jgi:2,4-dienoyl-CoA reductase-like NADH-dependent reductase (Old Yellow Enzyme family)
MWTPPERIKHELPPGGWPDRATAAASRWLAPVAVGPLQLRTRTWVPAMVPWRATEGGEVTPQVLDWYERFAAGQPGAIVVEATGIRDVPSGPLLRIGDDRFVPGLRALVERVRRASGGRTRLFIQLIDFLRVRRRPPRELFFRRFFALDDHHRRGLERLLGIAADDDGALLEALIELADDELGAVLRPRELEALQRGERERVTDVHMPHIARLPHELPGAFAAAAARAEAAGFDGVELHMAHAYTLASFLSARNTRSDGYGGDVAGRVRLPLEVLAAVQRRVTPGFVVGARILTEECIAGGSTLDDAVEFAVRLARAGLHFLSLSRGGKFEDAAQPAVGAAVYPYTGRSGYECMPTVRSDAVGPFGRNVAASAAVRAAVAAAAAPLPVVVSGGICSFAQAEALLAAGAADIVGAARQTLADPDWFLKLELGLGDRVRRCKYTNYCEALDQHHKQVTCQLWDRQQLEQAPHPHERSDDGRRRLVAPPWVPPARPLPLAPP